jgi:hypothetical protein
MRTNYQKHSVCVLLLMYWSSMIHAQNYIWGGPGDINSEFANGLKDWTTTETDGTKWVWDEDAMGKEGTYWSKDRGPLPSASAHNGVALFNSDYFHSNANIQYPHSGALTSPAFSTMGFESVFVRFDQDIRFWHPENRSYLQISTDGGNSWFPERGIEINPEIRGKWNKWVAPGHMIKLIDITPYALEQNHVQIRFVWEGSYYYWMIDDVFVMEQPEVELEITSAIYDPIAAQTPYSHADARESRFGLDVFNMGSSDVSNASAIVAIIDDEGEKIFEASLSELNIPAGDTTRIDFDKTFIPDYDKYKPHHYYISYRIDAGDTEELNYRNNESSNDFTLTDSRFNAAMDAKQYIYLPHSKGIFSIFHIGNYYIENAEVTWAMDSIGMKIRDKHFGSTFHTDVNVFVYKISDEVKEDFSNFDFSKAAQLKLDERPHPQMQLVGFGLEDAVKVSNNKEFKVGLFDMDFDDYIIVEADTRYLVLAHCDSQDTIFHYYDDEKYYNGTPVCGWYCGRAQNGVSHWNLDPWHGWDLSIDVQYFGCCDNTENKYAKEIISTYPNPADKYLNIELKNLDQIQAKNIRLLSMNKQVMLNKETQDNELKENLDISRFPAGIYFLEVQRKNGPSILKEVIIEH